MAMSVNITQTSTPLIGGGNFRAVAACASEALVINGSIVWDIWHCNSVVHFLDILKLIPCFLKSLDNI